MYERYWSLQESPFKGVGGCRACESVLFEEPLARLYYLVEQQRTCGVVVGPAGTGKSCLLKHFCREARRTQRIVGYVDLLDGDGQQLGWNLAAALGLAPTENEGPQSTWRRIEAHLRALETADVQAVIVVDHVDRGRGDCLRSLERLLSLGSTSHRITLLTAVRPDSPARARLSEFCDLRIEMTALERDQTHDYVEQTLAACGAERSLFEPAAIDALHYHSQGVLRTLNRLCDLSLTAGMGDRRRTIDADVVNGVAQSLQLASSEPHVQWRPSPRSGSIPVAQR